MTMRTGASPLILLGETTTGTSLWVVGAFGNKSKYHVVRKNITKIVEKVNKKAALRPAKSPNTFLRVDI